MGTLKSGSAVNASESRFPHLCHKANFRMNVQNKKANGEVRRQNQADGENP